MNLSEIKKISIRSYMESIGCNLKRDFGSYGIYPSPYRKDTTASLKVDYNKNLWCDFGGDNSGGSIIDLVMKVNGYSFRQSIDYLKNGKFESQSFSFHCKPNFEKTESQITITSVKEISNKYLIQYLHSRKIPIALANQYCKEVYYENGGKQYYAIGFPNNSGGYELRSKYFKGCTNKDITILKYENPQNQCLLFEGFFDLLSYLTLGNGKPINQDVLVLNSLSNINKAIPILKNYDLINGYLDNDESGKSAVNKLVSDGMNVLDKSYKYAPHKDLNEYLIHHSTTEKR